MSFLGRYLRLYLALGRYGLARELAFRGNFLVKLFVEVLFQTSLPEKCHDAAQVCPEKFAHN